MLKDRENKFEIVFLKKLIFLFFYCYNILILKIIFLKNTWWQHPTDPSRRKMDDGIGQQCPLHHIPFGFDIIKYCSR
jgi:hypothetical protein